jgi:hypothetical protein
LEQAKVVLLFGLTKTMNYMFMLLAMTFNTGIFATLMLGFTLSFFVLHVRSAKSSPAVIEVTKTNV